MVPLQVIKDKMEYLPQTVEPVKKDLQLLKQDCKMAKGWQ